MLTRRGFLTFLGASVASMAALSGYATAYEPLMRLDITRYAVTPPAWTPGLKLRIVAIADIHACEPWMPASRIRSLCETANGLGGDIIVLLGDYMSSMKFVSRHLSPSEWAEPLAALNAPLGVHAILGNHDWWDDRVAQKARGGETLARRALEAVGLPVYSNRAVRLEKDGLPFWLAGLEDQLALRPRRGNPRSGLDDLPGTLAQVADDAPILLLAHEPDIFPQVPDRVALTLSGHTHGGQVRLLGYAPLTSSKFGERYAYGHVVENGRNLIVSGGLGCSLAPVRFGSPPEIVVVDVG